MAVVLSEGSKGDEPNVSRDVQEGCIIRKGRNNKCLVTSVTLALCIIVFSVIELLVQWFQFEGLVGKEYFWKDLQRTLVTLDTNIPILLVVMLAASILIALLALFYMLAGKVSTFGFYMFFLTFRLFLCMTILAFFFQLYCFRSYYPSPPRQAQVAKEMQESLLDVHGLTAAHLPDDKGDSPWAATQSHFQCCGVKSYNDWLSAPYIRMNMLVKPAVLPLTCCQVPSKCRFRKLLVTGEILTNSSAEQGVLFTIEDEQASPSLCLPAKANQMGCLEGVLEKIDNARLHVLIDYGVLILCHFILLWSFKSSVTQGTYQGQIIPRQANTNMI